MKRKKRETAQNRQRRRSLNLFAISSMVLTLFISGCGASTDATSDEFYYPDSLYASADFQPVLYDKQEATSVVASESMTEDSAELGLDTPDGESTMPTDTEESEIQNADETTDEDTSAQTETQNTKPTETQSTQDTTQTEIYDKWSNLIALYKNGDITYEDLLYAGMTVSDLYGAGLVSLQEMLDAGLITEEGIKAAGLSLEEEQQRLEQNEENQQNVETHQDEDTEGMRNDEE